MDLEPRRSPAAATAISRGKGETPHVFKLTEDVHASESSFLKDGEAPAHHFQVSSMMPVPGSRYSLADNMPAQVTFEPPSYTEEKFALYSRYQQEIHHEAWERQPSGFKRFLVHSPLAVSTSGRPGGLIMIYHLTPKQREAIEYPSGRPDHLPAEYGTYHQLYRLDGKLVAFGVIDVLPRCVLSVYFMWEKEWEKFSLGKVSATVAGETSSRCAPTTNETAS